MSQNDLEIGNVTFPAFRTELNLQLKALASLQSHASDSTEPPTIVANMLWYDTGANTLKLRNEANNAWIDVLDANQTSSVVELLSKLKAPNGTVSAPSITFDSDTDTGIYRKAENTLAISANGTEKLSVSSSGVTIPTGTVTSLTSTTGSIGTLTATTGTITTGTVTTLTSTTANIGTVDLGDWTITEDASNNLLFAVSGVNKMKLDASGNLTVVGSVTGGGTI